MTSLSQEEMKAVRVPPSSYLGLNSVTHLDHNGGFTKMFAWKVLETCSAKFLSLKSGVYAKSRFRRLEVVGDCAQVWC